MNGMGALLTSPSKPLRGLRNWLAERPFGLPGSQQRRCHWPPNLNWRPGCLSRARNSNTDRSVVVVAAGLGWARENNNNTGHEPASERRLGENANDSHHGHSNWKLLALRGFPLSLFLSGRVGQTCGKQYAQRGEPERKLRLLVDVVVVVVLLSLLSY